MRRTQPGARLGYANARQAPRDRGDDVRDRFVGLAGSLRALQKMGEGSAVLPSVDGSHRQRSGLPRLEAHLVVMRKVFRLSDCAVRYPALEVSPGVTHHAAYDSHRKRIFSMLRRTIFALTVAGIATALLRHGRAIQYRRDLRGAVPELGRRGRVHPRHECG